MSPENQAIPEGANEAALRRTPQYPQQARFNNPSPLVVNGHTVVLLNASNRQQLELTVHSWELDSFFKKRGWHATANPPTEWCRRSENANSNKSAVVEACSMSNCESNEEAARWKWSRGETPQHTRGRKRPQQLKRRLHNELFCVFFFADQVRGRAAPFVTVLSTNIASPIGQSASQKPSTCHVLHGHYGKGQWATQLCFISQTCAWRSWGKYLSSWLSQVALLIFWCSWFFLCSDKFT